jgi:hypothetical protein
LQLSEHYNQIASGYNEDSRLAAARPPRPLTFFALRQRSAGRDSGGGVHPRRLFAGNGDMLALPARSIVRNEIEISAPFIKRLSNSTRRAACAMTVARNAELTCVARTLSGIDFVTTKTQIAGHS